MESRNIDYNIVKDQSNVAIFEYLGKVYYGKNYTNESIVSYIVMVFFVVCINISYEAILAKGGIHNVKDIGLFSGSMEDRILDLVALVITAGIIYMLEAMFWKLFKGNNEIKVISGKSVIKNNNIPMGRKHITFVRFFIVAIIFIIATVILINTKWDWMMGAIDAVGMYYGMIIVQSNCMKRLNTEYYIPVTFSVGCIAIQENSCN
ncbi:MAG: hypothetical protein IJ272_09350 [Clostridia bacterium]|nr:hypothetical protein [Clostridia bacterium]